MLLNVDFYSELRAFFGRLYEYLLTTDAVLASKFGFTNGLFGDICKRFVCEGFNFMIFLLRDIVDLFLPILGACAIVVV